MPWLDEFTEGDRVAVVEGYPGSVLAVSVGIDSTDYYVLLDNGKGEGWWAGHELTKTSMKATATTKAEVERRIAAEDYPDIGELLKARPNLVDVMDETEYLRSLTRTALYLPLPLGPQHEVGSSGYRKGWDDAVSLGYQAPESEDPAYMGEYRLGWAQGVKERGEHDERPLVDDLPLIEHDLTRPMDFDPDMGEQRVASQHAAAGAFWDILTGSPEPTETWEPGRNWSFDVCRYRRDSHCYFPKELDRAASDLAGYAVWVPEDRGHCKRVNHDDQRACPLFEPGPNEPGGYTDATIPWGEGGQRDGIPGEKIAGLTTVEAAWSDVQAKAHAIYASGGVRVLAVNMQDDGVHPETFYGQVQGDNGVYETGLDFVPGTFQVGSWVCTCAWAGYAWGRTRQWVKYEGRACSHMLALVYAMQSQGMSGIPDSEDEIAPDWLGEKTGASGRINGKVNGRVVSLDFINGQVLYDGQPYDGDVLHPRYDPTEGL